MNETCTSRYQGFGCSEPRGHDGDHVSTAGLKTWPAHLPWSPSGAIVGSREVVLAEVRKERIAQHEKWGEQNHPDGTSPHLSPFPVFDNSLPYYHAEAIRDLFRDATDEHSRNGTVTYRDILLEGVFEAMAESDKKKLRAELIRVAAVAVAWCEKLDREGA